MFMTAFIILANFVNFMMLFGWPVWKQLRFVYYLKTREVDFSHGPDLNMPWEIGEDRTDPFIACHIRIGTKEFYEWNVNNDGSLCKYNMWGKRKWFNRQRVLYSSHRERNFLGQQPGSKIKTISTRFFVAWAIKRYTQEQFVMAKMGGFKEYWKFKGN
tara:strand:+ start:2590 stop:3063 length:474 start_codon:yes stop_codon:yes gene_type:complete